MPTVECDRAVLADGVEISIEDATSGANGYFCLGCGQKLQARKGQINEAHFAHHSVGSKPLKPCDYSNETYRHDLAKRLLRRLKKIRVPAVYAACPPGYRGLLPRLAEGRDVEAATVLDERNVYLDELGDVHFARCHEPFDDHQGQRTLLARPDIVFLDAEGKHILLIEIYATHKVTVEKLSRLHTLGIDAIEIDIPASFEPDAIERLFSFTSHTHWLYNDQQANYRFLATDSPPLANGGATAAELEKRFSGRQETLKCRRSRVSNAIRGIRGCLGRADIAAVQRNARVAQETGEAFTAGLEATRAEASAQRDERNERLSSDIRERIAERRKALATQEREIAEQEEALDREERELERNIRAAETRLQRIATYVKSRIKRAESAVEDECSRERTRIRNERERCRNELSRIGREAAAVVSAAARFDPARTALEREESVLSIAAAANRRGLERATADLRKIELAIEAVEEQTARLGGIESQIT